MTKKDYELLARVFRNARRDCIGHKNAGAMLRGIFSVQKLLSSELHAYNPRFDPDKFNTACCPFDNPQIP